jgi:hypothetical protein
VTKGASRYFDVISPETVTWEGRRVNFYYLEFNDTIDNDKDAADIIAFAI